MPDNIDENSLDRLRLQEKYSYTSIVSEEATNDRPIERTNDSVIIDDSILPNERNIENAENVLESMQENTQEGSKNLQKVLDSNQEVLENVPNPVTEVKNVIQSHSVKQTKNGKKIKRKSKTSPLGRVKNKKADNKQINKTIDKYFTTQSQYKVKSANEENLNPNHTEIISDTNTNEQIEENVIFEGTVINSTGDTSIIIPLKTESSNHELRFDNVEMADGNEIIQAQEIVFISNDSQLPDSRKSETNNLKNSISPSPGDLAQPMNENEIELEQASGQHISLISSSEQLIVLEVQLPAKENTIALPKNVAALKRIRSISSTSSERRFSEGKIARISELMTEEQKRNIETSYSIDMTLVDQKKVEDNVTVLQRNKIQCKICEAIYPRLDKCQVHVWRHLDMKPYLCKVCDFSTLTVSNIRCHIRKSHLKIKPFECYICHKCYNSSTLLEEHLNTHTGERPYQCNDCDFASTTKQVLSHHVLIHKAEKDIICDICGKAFYSKGRMRAHHITHNKEKAFKCKYCSTYVLNQDALDRHFENVHSKDYICKICNKVYKSRKSLHNHESVHSEAKFKCPMCDNVYKSTHILKEHILKHKGIRKYKCNKCDKSFAQQSHLAAHMAVHSNITYNCPGCQKGFNRHDNMKVHTKRCEKFQANPALQDILKKRKISYSKNNTAKVSTKKDNNFTEQKKDYKNSHPKKTANDKLVNKDAESSNTYED